MRFFANTYPDYDGSKVQIDARVWIAKAIEIANTLVREKRNVEGTIDGGLYVGPAGVAYSLLKLASNLPEQQRQESSELVKRAQHLVNLNLMYFQHQNLERDKTLKVGFLLGATGAYAVAAAIAKAQGNESLANEHLAKFTHIAAERILEPVVVHQCGSDELL